MTISHSDKFADLGLFVIDIPRHYLGTLRPSVYWKWFFCKYGFLRSYFYAF